MKNLREQTDAKIAEGRLKNPDFMKGVDAAIEESKAFEQGENAIKVGEKAPRFKLPNARGKSVSLDNLLENGPVVISFYRGDWCPYCNLQIKALQEVLSEIHELGANLVAISPQVPDESLTKVEISKMGYIASFKTKSNQKEDIVMSNNKNAEYGNQIPTKQDFPFDLKDNEAVISYTENATLKYLLIKNIKEKSRIEYPSAPQRR